MEVCKILPNGFHDPCLIPLCYAIHFYEFFSLMNSSCGMARNDRHLVVFNLLVFLQHSIYRACLSRNANAFQIQVFYSINYIILDREVIYMWFYTEVLWWHAKNTIKNLSHISAGWPSVIQGIFCTFLKNIFSWNFLLYDLEWLTLI